MPEQPYETVLIIDSAKVLRSLSTFAFTLSQGRKKKVRGLYLDATVIYRNGAVRRIQDIAFLGAYGKNPFFKLFSTIQGYRRIRVDLVDQPAFGLDDLKQAVLSLHPDDFGLEDSSFMPQKPLSEVLQIVADAETAAEIFDAVGVPPPEDVLDILC